MPASVVVVSGLGASDRGFARLVCARLRAADFVIVDHDAGVEVISDGLVGAVVHLAGAASDGVRLDDALSEDIYRSQAMAAVATAHGVPFIVASRLSVVGPRRGLHPEADPRTQLFGGSAVLGKDIDVIAERRSLTERAAFARATVDHADACAARRQLVADRMRAQGGPDTGPGFEAALAAHRATEIDDVMRRTLVDAAAGWRFMTASPQALRGFTRALGELCACQVADDVAVTLVRLPGVMAARDDDEEEEEDDDHVPSPALLTQRARLKSGAVRLPFADRARVEALPTDVIADAVATVVRAAVAAVDAGESVPGVGVVHVCTHAETPLSTERVLDLFDLHLRRHDDARPLSTRLLSVDQSTRLPALVDVGRDLGLNGLAAATASFSRGIGRISNQAETAAKETRAAIHSMRSPSGHDVAVGAAPPFFGDDVRFAQRGLRVAAAKAGLPPVDLRVDWRSFMRDRHLPLLDVRLRARDARSAARARQPVPPHASLGQLLITAARRFGKKSALSQFSSPQAVAAGAAVTVDVSYQELLDRARAVALRLQSAGVVRGDRVVIAGDNAPAWGIVAFGAVLLGATLVPLDPNLEDPAARMILKKARARIAVVDVGVRGRIGAALADTIEAPVLDMQLTATTGPGLDLDGHALSAPDDVASILFTSGTTGDPKGVMLSHKNFCALLGSLLAVFPVTGKDRLLSVLPLHHTFEFTCGLLMPLACGAQIFTPDALVGERVLSALKAGRITAIVGVPALWQLLERRMKKTAEDGGELQASAFQTLLRLNKKLGARFGVSLGPIILKRVHDQLGGHLRVLISGGSALPPSTHELFQGLGLPLAEGYGLTETAPVLTVAEGKLGMPAGTVGTPIPGVQLKLVDPDSGVDVTAVAGAMGEIWARADNVMVGYFDNDEATRAVLTDDGWLKTGDLGTFDTSGRVKLVGRSKDVVVTAAGENIYLDDVEKRLEDIPGVFELALLGIADPKGGERLALAFVVGDDADSVVVDVNVDGAAGAHADRVNMARQLVGQRVLKLPAFQRPAVIEAWSGLLPRTASRKVKRREVKAGVEAILKARALRRAESEPEAGSGAGSGAGSVVVLNVVERHVTDAVASTAGVEVATLSSSTSLTADLGFDSLMWVELQGQLEQRLSIVLDPELLVTKETLAEVCAIARDATSNTSGGGSDGVSDDDRVTRGVTGDDDDAWPPLVQEALKLAVAAPSKKAARAALSLAQRRLFRDGFDTEVRGGAFIPANRNVIVVANHTSHLDTGLVKYALGEYGSGLRPLAAKDYFFEGNPLKVAFFEHLTNLVPIDRETGSGLAFEQAKAVVLAGHVVLIFPEGTRREDGTLGSFKPLVAKLAMATNTDVLPIYLEGCFEAFPRGASRPRFGRRLVAHVGPPLEASALARLTAHLPAVKAARAAADVIRESIVALRDGKALELSKIRDLDDIAATGRVVNVDSDDSRVG
jgi:long-chain acyl-CoA synthetase